MCAGEIRDHELLSLAQKFILSDNITTGINKFKEIKEAFSLLSVSSQIMMVAVLSWDVSDSLHFL